MADIKHKIGIKAPEDQVFKALSTEFGLANWWTQDTRADQHQGGNIHFSFAKRLDSKFDVLVNIALLQPNKQICWQVIEGPDECLGTDIVFDLQPQSEETIVYFNHNHWLLPTDFMAQCNTKWAVFLLSLRDYIEKGQGQPFPNDVIIGHYGA